MESKLLNRITGLVKGIIIVILVLTAVAGGKSDNIDNSQDYHDKEEVLAGDNWEFIRHGIWERAGDDGAKTVALFSEVLAPDVIGYGGHIPLYIFIEDEVIKRIEVGDHVETPSFFRKLTDADYFEQFIGESITEIRAKEYDVVSRATISSNAIIRGLKQSVTEYIGEEQERAKIKWSMIAGSKSIAGLLIVAFALVNFIFYKSNKKLRLLQMILNLVVLGYYSGTVLSMELFLSYARNGLTLSSGIVFLVIMLFMISLALFGKKNFYCSWVCPFGAAQELVGKITKKSIVFSSDMQKYLLQLRSFLLFILLFAAWLLNGSYIFEYEPFSAFVQTDMAAHVALQVAVFMLAISVFIKKFWCRYLCPTGALISFVEKDN